MNKKILFCTPDLLGVGGIQFVSRLGLQALRDEYGDRTCVTVYSHVGATTAIAGVHRGPCVVGCGKKFRGGLRLAALLSRERWDAVLLMHVHLAQVLPAQLWGRPTLVFLHGIEVWRPLPWLVRLGLQRADRVVSNSLFTLRRATDFHPWFAHVSSGVCHLGIPPAELVQTQDPGKGAAASSFALTIGRMVGEERYKGFDELLKVWPAVQRARPGLRLVLIGDGPDRPRLEALARSVGADAVFLGPADDATRDRYLRGCTAFLLPSRAEGFGLVYLEAMRVGKPVLAGSGDAAVEVIPDAEVGRTVDPADTDALLAGILDLTGPNAQRYGAAGLQRFHDHFTYAHFRDRFIAEVGALMERRPTACVGSQV